LKRLITLITDFGTKDYYVPSLVGQIKSINPSVEILHLTHEIKNQNIIEAAFTLKNSYPNFSPETIHVVVVDPEVGGERDAVLVKHNGHYFVSPDNGILSLAFETTKPDQVFSILNSPYKNRIISPVFHGRDIFTPIAAYLSLGVPPKLLGTLKSELLDLRWSLPSYDKQRIIGQIIHIDHFGNLISNVTEIFLRKWQQNENFVVSMPGWEPMELSQSYSDVEAGDPVALIGSSGQLEIAVYQSNANQLFDLNIGSSIIIEKSK